MAARTGGSGLTHAENPDTHDSFTLDRELQLHAFIDSLPQLVLGWTHDGACDYVGARWLEYTGGVAWNGIQNGWLQWVHPDDQPTCMQHWDVSRETGEPFRIEVRLRRHDGVFRRHMLRVVPRKNMDQPILRWLGAFSDIEEQKAAEETLRRAEKLDVAERLAAVLAHEVNNPLTSVANLLYLVDGETIPPAARQYIQLAQKELSRAMQAVTRNLQFHHQQTTPVPVRIPSLIDSALAGFEERLRGAKVTVFRRYKPVEPLTCWAADLNQVITGLLANAVDAMRPAGGRLVIRVADARERRAHHQERGIVITIADTGRGMSPDVVGRACEPFFSTKGITGTGLGLWVARKAIDRHSGTLKIKSSTYKNHRGTVVRIFLPYKTEAALAAKED